MRKQDGIAVRVPGGGVGGRQRFCRQAGCECRFAPVGSAGELGARAKGFWALY